MPSWKKVILSGSDAALNSLTVSNGITGSLFGTASYANFAATASNASNSQNAQDILIYVKNTTGAQINKGKVVRISGATGDNALIATASYTDDANSANTLGITYQNIPNDSFGYVITEGTLIGIDTDTFSAGQLLYLGASGAIIGTAPQAPLHAVRLGQVLRVQQNNGSMYVRIDNGYELGELHDVVDTTTASSYGDLLVKSGSVWTNSRQLTGSYALTGSLQATSFTGSLFGTSSFASTASFLNSTTNAFIQNGNSFDTLALLGTNDNNSLALETNGTTRMFISSSGNVGINKTTPNAILDVNGNTIITGSLAVSQSLLQYSNITAVTSGSTSNVASFNTSSFTAAFFDYVTTSGTSARAGSVFTVWNGNSVEYVETSTNDIGNTNNLLLSASVSAGAVRLQATSLSGSWSVKTLVRMI